MKTILNTRHKCSNLQLFMNKGAFPFLANHCSFKLLYVNKYFDTANQHNDHVWSFYRYKPPAVFTNVELQRQWRIKSSTTGNIELLNGTHFITFFGVLLFLLY